MKFLQHTAVALLTLGLCGGASAAAKPARHPAAKHARKAPPKPARKAVDYVGEQVNFGQWQAVSDFIDGMVVRNGFARTELETLFAQVRFVDAAIQLVKPAPPGKPKNWQAYRQLTVDAVRVKAGVQFWDAHADTLARAEQQHGVPADIIVGILGVETVYGRNTGRFRVMDALTTLAFSYPQTPNRAARMDFFRGELENVLLLARRAGIAPLSLTGSFAGAVGMPQFMPGSIMAWGADGDGDGIIDLRTSAADAIFSVANFLVRHGFKPQLAGPPAYPVTVSPDYAWQAMLGQGLVARYGEQELLAAGVIATQVLPEAMLFGLVDLQNGAEATEYWLGNDNFFAITQYNRSYFYAMGVLELGRAVRAARLRQLGGGESL